MIVYSRDDETFDYTSLGGLIDAEELQVGDTYYEGEAYVLDMTALTNNFINNILENLDEIVFSETGYGDYVHETFCHVSDQAKKELSDFLIEWDKKHIKTNYWVVTKSVQKTIEEGDL
jgi:hypothetical protein